MDNYDQLKDILVRSRTGYKISPQDQQVLREAIKGFAPSSAEYRMINEALNSATPITVAEAMPERAGPPGDGPFSFGGPTLDFLEGTSRPTLDWLGGMAGRMPPSGPERLPGRRSQPYDFPNPAAPSNDVPPTTPDQGPDTIQDPREQNAKLMAEQATNPKPDQPGETFTVGMSGVAEDQAYERATNWGAAPGFWEEPLESPGPIDPGYSFSEMNPGMIANAYNDPQLMMRLIASDAGQGPASEAMMMPYLQSARALAGMGVLGGSGSMDFEGVQDDPIGAFQTVEEFMDTFNEPGMQFIDQSELRNRILDRAVGQDWSQMTDQYGQPWDHDQIIETTNQALLASAPFMTNEAAALMSSKLQAAALEYKNLLATGEISVSYPDYLKNTVGIGEMFA